MRVKTTDKGHEYIEIDCQYKDFEGKFPCYGKIGVIRFFYKKDIPLRFDNIKIGDKEFDDKIDYGTLDWKYLTMGMVDVFKQLEFKEGDDFVLKQFSTPNSDIGTTKLFFDNYRNSIEKIQLFFERKIKPMEWKSVNEHKPKISVMEKSQHDLLIFDGKDYHRGYAKAVLTTEPTNENLYDIKYFSHETNSYINNALMFIEIEPVKNGHMNIWRTIWNK